METTTVAALRSVLTSRRICSDANMLRPDYRARTTALTVLS